MFVLNIFYFDKIVGFGGGGVSKNYCYLKYNPRPEETSESSKLSGKNCFSLSLSQPASISQNW